MRKKMSLTHTHKFSSHDLLSVCTQSTEEKSKRESVEKAETATGKNTHIQTKWEADTDIPVGCLNVPFVNSLTGYYTNTCNEIWRKEFKQET